VVSYTLASTETGDVDECVPGEGALLGDMYMKDALLSLIKRDAQSYADVDNIEELDSTKFQAEFDNFWREACRTPAGTGRDTEVNDFKIQGADGKYYLPFPVLRLARLPRELFGLVLITVSIAPMSSRNSEPLPTISCRS
jgi:hypothetical protein